MSRRNPMLIVIVGPTQKKRRTTLFIDPLMQDLKQPPSHAQPGFGGQLGVHHRRATEMSKSPDHAPPLKKEGSFRAATL